MDDLENMLDKASLKKQKVFPVKEINTWEGKIPIQPSCYLKEGLVSIMPKCYNEDWQVEFYDVWGSI